MCFYVKICFIISEYQIFSYADYNITFSPDFGHNGSNSSISVFISLSWDLHFISTGLTVKNDFVKWTHTVLGTKHMNNNAVYLLVKLLLEMFTLMFDPQTWMVNND